MTASMQGPMSSIVMSSRHHQMSQRCARAALAGHAFCRAQVLARQTPNSHAVRHLGACFLRVSSIAGPGKAWSALEQGQYLFELAERKPNFIKVPVALMDGIIGFLYFLAKIFPGLEVRPHLTMPLTAPGKAVLLQAGCLHRQKRQMHRGAEGKHASEMMPVAFMGYSS